MADRPVNIGQNMAVSSASVASQYNHKDVGKEENDIPLSQGNSKTTEQPKKKTTFKITNVTKSSAQRGGSGDLTGDNDHDIDSTDDLDETVDPDSHTEEINSEILDMSRGTDIDNQDILTPDEMIKEKGITSPEESAIGTGKSARFKVVKVETREPFRRGRWECLDFLDEKTDNKQDEIQINSGNSSGANSVYDSGVDDQLKNPNFAGASGTMPVLYQQPSMVDGGAATKGEMFQPIHPAPVSLSQPGLTLVNQLNSDHIAQSAVPHSYSTPAQSLGSLTMAVVPNHLMQGTVPNLPPMPTGQTYTNQSLAGNIPYSSGQSQQMPQSTIVPQSMHPHVPHSLPQPLYDMTGQKSTYVINAGPMSMATNTTAVIGGNIPNMIPQQNHQSTGVPSQPPIMDGYVNDHELQPSRNATLIAGQQVNAVDNQNSQLTIGAGPQPLELAVGEITNPPAEEEITEEALLEYFSNLSTYGGQPGQLPPPVITKDESGYTLCIGSSTVAIDNKIEQAMDLVKSHLMYAVREEVEVLKEQIKELMDRMRQVEFENKILRADASPETLAKLPPALPPLSSNPTLQQFMTTSNSST